MGVGQRGGSALARPRGGGDAPGGRRRCHPWLWRPAPPADARSGVVHEYRIAPPGQSWSRPTTVTNGPDGRLWFAEAYLSAIAHDVRDDLALTRLHCRSST